MAELIGVTYQQAHKYEKGINRIAAGRFTLDGQTYTLATNDGPNALHGGTAGFDKRLWTITAVKGGAAPSVTLRYVSPDGEEGYPGTLAATAICALAGARIYRVHEVAETRQVLDMVASIRGTRPPARTTRGLT